MLHTSLSPSPAIFIASKLHSPATSSAWFPHPPATTKYPF